MGRQRDREAKGCKRGVLGGCAVSQRTTYPFRMVIHAAAETACWRIGKEKSHMNILWWMFLPLLRDFVRSKAWWKDRKNGRTKVSWKSAVCLAWMVLSLVSLFHKINSVNEFNVKELVIQRSFCSIAFAHTVKGNLKKLHCEDFKYKSSIKNNQDYFLL